MQNETIAEPEKRESIKKVRNPFRKPTSFRFSGYRKSETISLSDAKKELRNLYPRIANVSFLCSRVNNVLHGWVNFKNPFDCSQTYDEIQTLNPLELKLSPVESCFDAEFAHNLKPLPPIFVAKKEGPKNFTKKYRRKFFEKALKWCKFWFFTHLYASFTSEIIFSNVFCFIKVKEYWVNSTKSYFELLNVNWVFAV